MSPSGLYALGACLLSLIATSAAIKCYDCTTANPEQVGQCEDPFLSEADQVNCATVDEREHNVCRKITTIQYAVEGTGDIEEVGRVVTRYCGGPDTDDLGCTMVDGVGSESYECSCDEDGCNASGTLIANISTVAMATLAVAMLGRLASNL